jgi:hypothetical protein
VEQVEAAEAALDMRHRNAKHPPHQSAEHGRHRVAVNEHERTRRSAVEAPAQAGTLACKPPRNSGQPTGDIGVRAQVSVRPSTPEPDVRLRQIEQVEQSRDLLDLLAGRRGHVAAAALPDPDEKRGELDQLAGRSIDDEDHVLSRSRSIISAPRHMPAPWATA